MRSNWPRPRLKPGSLLYGKAVKPNEGRQKYVQEVHNEFHAAVRSNAIEYHNGRKAAPVTVDHLTKLTGLSQTDQHNKTKVTKTDDLTINLLTLGLGGDPEQKSELAKTTSAGANHWREDALNYGRSIVRYEHELKNPSFENSSKSIVSQTDYNQRMTRTSKFGIVHTVARGKRIQFALDDLPLEGIARKHDFASQPDKEGKSITGSELRFIYRNWDHVKNNIDFIKDGRLTHAPWEEGVDDPGINDSQDTLSKWFDDRRRVSSWRAYGGKVRAKHGYRKSDFSSLDNTRMPDDPPSTYKRMEKAVLGV